MVTPKTESVHSSDVYLYARERWGGPLLDMVSLPLSFLTGRSSGMRFLYKTVNRKIYFL